MADLVYRCPRIGSLLLEVTDAMQAKRREVNIYTVLTVKVWPGVVEDTQWQVQFRDVMGNSKTLRGYPGKVPTQAEPVPLEYLDFVWGKEVAQEILASVEAALPVGWTTKDTAVEVALNGLEDRAKDTLAKVALVSDELVEVAGVVQVVRAKAETLEKAVGSETTKSQGAWQNLSERVSKLEIARVMGDSQVTEKPKRGAPPPVKPQPKES